MPTTLISPILLNRIQVIGIGSKRPWYHNRTLFGSSGELMGLLLGGDHEY
jgi:hypothetical protein